MERGDLRLNMRANGQADRTVKRGSMEWWDCRMGKWAGGPAGRRASERSCVLTSERADVAG